MGKKIEVQIVGDADSLHRALGKASDSTSRFGRVAAGVGKAGFLALGGAAVGASIGIYKAVQAGSDWNETLNKAHVIFGKSSDDAQLWSEHMAEAGGISEQAALDAATTFGTFGKAAGVAKNELFGWSAELVNAASDLASFHNADPSQVLEDIRSGLAGEVEPLRKYGILMNDAALRTQALKMGLVSTTKDALTPNNKMLAAQALILQKLGPAAGDFARTSQGLANQQRILKAELENVVTQLGSALLPIVVKVAQFAIPLTIAVIKELAGKIRSVIKWIQQFASHFEILGNKSASGSQRIRNAFGQVVAFFRANVFPIIHQLQAIFQASMQAIGKVVQQHGAEVNRIMSRVGAALQAIAKVAIPILRYALTKTLPKAIGQAIHALDNLTNFLSIVATWAETAYNWITRLGQAINNLPAIPDVNQGLLNGLGIDINKGLVGQLPGLGGPGGIGNPAGGGKARPLQANLYLDGKLVYQSMVNQDKISRRQTGRSLLANG